MKTCTKCNTPEDDEEFSWANKSIGRRKTICKTCVAKNSKHNYHNPNNKSRYIREASRRGQITRHTNQAWIRELKATLKCSHCPESHPAVLDFHHPDPTQKEFGIATLSTQTISRHRILKEISKCIVLCSNCHRKLHWNERQQNSRL